MVRDWIETTLPVVEENLARFFRRQHIVPLFRDGQGLFSVRELVSSLAPARRRRPGAQ